MPEDVTAERVAAIAAAARVPLPPDSPQRIANSIRVAARRFAEGPVAYPFEAEPSSYVVVAREDAQP